jgi:diguanylate cyclase (GGDEF)-like protein/PAS domain S-box-containing protein
MNILVHETDFTTLDRPIAPSEDQALYQTLLESTQAIPWKLNWGTMRFEYIGPQIEQLLGWQQDSWLTVEDWATRIHEDDRERVVNFCVSQSQAGIDHEADYRALTAWGDEVWIRDVVHVVRGVDGQVESLIGFMFDISERKKSEDEVLRLQKELERLSFTDSLTGVGNRRAFDQTMQSEWRCADRSGEPLSLILLDVDCFKAFNDTRGHLAGDECLVKIAQMLDKVGKRPRDLVARYGGEEFVILLPETDLAGATEVAQACLKAIRNLAIDHPASDCGATVTASAGVGTMAVDANRRPEDLIGAVDDLLYLAKENGRNRLEASQIG